MEYLGYADILGDLHIHWDLRQAGNLLEHLDLQGIRDRLKGDKLLDFG